MNRGTHLTFGDTGRAEDRVVRIVNLHYEAGIDDIYKFFGNSFIIVDFIRGVNPKTNKNTVGYVLFATEQERINAQTLSGRQLLDREVKVLPAHGGFGITPSGDKLLPSTASQSATPSQAYKTLEVSPPAINDVESFPSLGTAATPRLGARALVHDTPTRKQPAQQRALQNHLLFTNNIGQGPEVNETSFHLFFGKYTVVDVKRPIDLKTSSPHPTAFVMLASAEQRDEALYHLKDVPMQGRKVTMEVPKTFQNFDQYGFVPSSSESVVTFSTRRADTVASKIARAPFATNTFVREGLQPAMPSVLQKIPVTAPSTEEIDFHTLPRQLTMTEHGTQQQASPKTHVQHQQEVEVVLRVEDARQAKKTKFTWDVSREELTKRYVGQQRTLLPMPSGVEGPSQVLTGPPMTPPVEYASPFARPLGSMPRGPPPDIDTSFRPREYDWSLSDTQDPARNIISEEAWYGGLQAHQKFKNEQKQAVPPTVKRKAAENDDFEGDEDDVKRFGN